MEVKEVKAINEEKVSHEVKEGKEDTSANEEKAAKEVKVEKEEISATGEEAAHEAKVRKSTKVIEDISESQKLSIIDNFKMIMTEKYATFSGRAGRAEYWKFMLIYISFSIVVGLLRYLAVKEGFYFAKYIEMALHLPFIIPFLALSVRRLHDINLAGWLFVSYFIPLLGQLIFIYFNVQRSIPYSNKYGYMPGDGILMEMPPEYIADMELAEKYNSSSWPFSSTKKDDEK